jgi:hypothetical protein
MRSQRGDRLGNPVLWFLSPLVTRGLTLLAFFEFLVKLPLPTVNFGQNFFMKHFNPKDDRYTNR